MYGESDRKTGKSERWKVTYSDMGVPPKHFYPYDDINIFDSKHNKKKFPSVLSKFFKYNLIYNRNFTVCLISDMPKKSLGLQ